MTVDFSLSADQAALTDVFGRFFAAESTSDTIRATEPLGFSADLWAKLGAMEAPAIGVDGASMADLVAIAETIGTSIAPVPLIEHWLASRLVPEDDAIRAGGAIATLALRPAVGGVWSLVPAGAVADVVVGIDGGDTVAVRTPAPMIAPANHGSMALADRSAVAGERVVLGDESLLHGALDAWRVLTASALVGVADAALGLAVDYVLERHQFGRPIGSYQALQHGLADFPAAIDGARFLTHKAAWAIDTGLVDGAGQIDMEQGLITESAPLASMALLAATDAATMCTARSVQYHGGYGFSAEYDIQLFFRRARAWAGVLGNPSHERARVTDFLWPRETVA